MSDVDHCGCNSELETLKTELDEDGATEVIRCTECGQTWTWDRNLTITESAELFNRECRRLGHEILKAVGLR